MPIPDHTANIFFTVHFPPPATASKDTPNLQLSYTIENNKFIHNSAYGGVIFREEWIDRVIEGKQVTQMVLQEVL